MEDLSTHPTSRTSLLAEPLPVKQRPCFSWNFNSLSGSCLWGCQLFTAQAHTTIQRKFAKLLTHLDEEIFVHMVMHEEMTFLSTESRPEWQPNEVNHVQWWQDHPRSVWVMAMWSCARTWHLHWLPMNKQVPGIRSQLLGLMRWVDFLFVYIYLSVLFLPFVS